jgi:ubiquitin-protein ligase
MSVIISSTNSQSEYKYNTSITDIIINGIKYKYYCNDNNYKYVTSSEQSKEIVDYINILLSNNNIDWNNISELVSNYKSSNDINNIISIDDTLNIFNINTKTKYKHNQNILLNNFLSKCNQCRKNLDNIPKELILNNKQLANMLLTEINKINTNDTQYSHYIVCNNNDLMNISIRFVYNNEKMEKFNQKHGYNYFEINLKLSDLHPYLPPIVSYVKPKIDTNLVSNILGLDIWNPSSWNYLISLEWIVVNLGNTLEEHFMNSIDIDNNPFDFIEIKMLELLNYNKTSNINLNFNKIITDTKTNNNSGFKAGTGYGSGSNNEKWDITKYIDINKTNEKNSINILFEINNYIDKSNKSFENNKIIIPEKLINYIINKFNSSNLLYFNNNIDLFKVLIESLDLMMQYIIVNNNIKFDIIDEIKALVNNETSIDIDEKYMCTYLHYIDIYDKYSKLSSIKELSNKDANNDEETYIKMIKEQNYNKMILNNSHRFYKERGHKISSKTVMRIMGELSSLKKDLPINWDSSIIMRIVPTNTNLISFIIIGPKDTPYHNGLFEFHAYFPDGYPSVVPQVLINTTDNDKVRFNPNLYSNGKVCLSLLGTWSGQKGESWIPEISTFFQVIISIQSLIMVDEPYFNEPGYERSSGTEIGKKNSEIYNDTIRYETMRVGMLGMLNNKPPSYEDFINQHFKLKKNEIINVLNKWHNESLNKEKFKKIFDELIKKLDQL